MALIALTGTLIVTVGLVTVGSADYLFSEEEDESDGTSGQTIGTDHISN